MPRFKVAVEFLKHYTVWADDVDEVHSVIDQEILHDPPDDSNIAFVDVIPEEVEDNE